VTQTWDPATYARDARFVAELGAPVVELLSPKPGERILDLGCGDGALSTDLAALGCEVVGIDSSEAQVEAARARGLDARVMDARALEFTEEFDAVFSNAVLHWVRDPDAAIAGAWRALRPGGRFVGEFGGDKCVERIRQALIAALDRRGFDGAAYDPWYFPRPEDYRPRLERAGFRVSSIALIPRPTPLTAGMRPWLEIFAGPFISALSPDARDGYLDEVVDRLRPALCNAEGQWTADYTRLRFRAERPAHGAGA